MKHHLFGGGDWEFVPWGSARKYIFVEPGENAMEVECGAGSAIS